SLDGRRRFARLLSAPLARRAVYNHARTDDASRAHRHARTRGTRALRAVDGPAHGFNRSSADDGTDAHARLAACARTDRRGRFVRFSYRCTAQHIHLARSDYAFGRLVRADAVRRLQST